MNLLTLLIVLGLVIAAVHGYRAGLGHVVLPSAGAVGGLVLGVRLAPRAMLLVDQVGAKVAVAVAVALLAVAVGHAVGTFVARRLDRASDQVHLGPLTRSLGAAVQAAFVLFVVWLLASGLGTVEAYGIGRQVQTSPIIRTLNSALPAPPDIVSRLKGVISPNGFPTVFVAGEPQRAPVSPGQGVDAATVAVAERSVVQVVGPGCGGVVEGSGFVVAPGAVVTNAHVVAGVRQPTVVDAAGRHSATVVDFDPNEDVAVLVVDGLRAPVLATGSGGVPAGSPGATLGYPGGGPLRADGAVVLDRTIAVGQNIYNQGTVHRAIYEIAGAVEPGSSGGPLITADGRVAGIVFARSVSQDHLGYALVWDEVAAQVGAASRRSVAVPTGACSAG